MPAPANLIRESSTSTGTGNLTLAAVNGYVRFSDSTYGFGTGGSNAFWYFISNRNAAEWEIGTGHMLDANTLVRDTVLFSSNANAAVSFAAGTKDISNDIPASYQVFVEGTPAQGDVIYRNASAWTRLAAGTNRQFLQTQGSGANPQWAYSGLTLLNSGTVSSAATLDIVLTSYTAYRGLMVLLANFIPATDGVAFMLRLSTNGGSSYDSGASDYKWVANEIYVGGSGVQSSGGASEIRFSNTSIGNDSVGGISMNLWLRNQTSTSRHPTTSHVGSFYANDDNLITTIGAGRRLAAQDTDAIRFLFSSGNISSGSWALYGYS